MTPPPPPEGPTIASAVYSSVAGRIVVTASEAVTVIDTSTTPWTVTFNGAGQAVTSVAQAGANVRVSTAGGGAPGSDIRLSFAGGPFVQGNVSGLFLQAFSNFSVTH